VKFKELVRIMIDADIQNLEEMKHSRDFIKNVRSPKRAENSSLGAGSEDRI